MELTQRLYFSYTWVNEWNRSTSFALNAFDIAPISSNHIGNCLSWHLQVKNIFILALIFFRVIVYKHLLQKKIKLLINEYLIFFFRPYNKLYNLHFWENCTPVSLQGQQ